MLAAPSPQPSSPPLFSSSISASTATSRILIVFLIIAIAILASVSFNLLRYLMFRRRRSCSPPPSSASGSSAPPPSDQNHIVFSFPVPNKSPDCAVCLSPFCPSDDLRLLPSCRHAFHLRCIDLWLQSTPSCPLCRSPAAPPEESGASSSFQVGIDLSHSLDCSIEQISDDAVVDQLEDPPAGSDLMKDGEEADLQVEIMEEEEGVGDGWLREYLDRMVSDASTSFNSLAFSGRLSSHRFDSGSIESVAGGDGRSWEMEGVEWVEESGIAGIYRWFMGI